MDAIAQLKDVWFLIIPSVALVIWVIRLEGLAKGNKERGLKNEGKIDAALLKSDGISEEFQVMKSRVRVHGDLLKPDKLAEHYTAQATFQAETKKDIGRLMDAARKAGAF